MITITCFLLAVAFLFSWFCTLRRMGVPGRCDKWGIPVVFASLLMYFAGAFFTAATLSLFCRPDANNILRLFGKTYRCTEVKLVEQPPRYEPVESAPPE